MREIKFKAYDKYDKKIYKVESINFNCFEEIETITIFENDSLLKSYNKNHTSELCDINALVLMQYTGLTDKNGVEIYENDVVRYDSGFGGYEASTIFYDEYRLSLNFRTDFGYNYIGLWELRNQKNIEVIGNVWNDSYDSE